MVQNGQKETESIPFEVGEVPEGAILATPADFRALIQANPSLQLPLTNIIQQRLLAEKDAEIAALKATAAARLPKKGGIHIESHNQTGGITAAEVPAKKRKAAKKV